MGRRRTGLAAAGNGEAQGFMDFAAMVGGGLDSLATGYQQGEDRKWQEEKRQWEREDRPLRQEAAQLDVERGRVDLAAKRTKLERELAWLKEYGIDPQGLVRETGMLGSVSRVPEVMDINKGQDVPAANIIKFNNALGNPSVDAIRITDDGKGFETRATDPKTGQSQVFPLDPNDVRKLMAYAGPVEVLQFYGGLMKKNMDLKAQEGLTNAKTAHEQARVHEAEATTGLRQAQVKTEGDRRENYAARTREAQATTGLRAAQVEETRRKTLAPKVEYDMGVPRAVEEGGRVYQLGGDRPEQVWPPSPPSGGGVSGEGGVRAPAAPSPVRTGIGTAAGASGQAPAPQSGTPPAASGDAAGARTGKTRVKASELVARLMQRGMSKEQAVAEVVKLYGAR